MWTGADDETPERVQYPVIPMPTLAGIASALCTRRVPREPNAALLLAADRAREARRRAMQPTWDAICRSLASEQRRQRRTGC